MKLSEITMEEVTDFLRIEPEDCEENLMKAAMQSARSYILSFTGLSAEEADEKEDFYIAFMVLCQDMYDNRSLYVDKSNINKTVESILGMYRVNLL